MKYVALLIDIPVSLYTGCPKVMVQTTAGDRLAQLHSK